MYRLMSGAVWLRVKGMATHLEGCSGSGGPTLHRHLRQLFNLSLIVGHIPARWKKAVIIPLPREGKDLSSPEGYRPISLLPTIAKLLEAIISRKLYGILETTKAIPDHQSGFRAHRSTEDQLFRLAETSPIAAAPGMVRWLSNFLQGRQFCTRVGAMLSDCKAAKAGVPQGSCLSPILFIFFTADIFCSRNCDKRPAVGSYADDVMVMAVDKEAKAAARLVQLALRQAEWWSSAWRLPLQPSKCVAIPFTRSHTAPDINLYIDGSRLTIEAETTYLGVVFDRKMSFRSHFREVANFMSVAVLRK